MDLFNGERQSKSIFALITVILLFTGIGIGAVAFGGETNGQATENETTETETDDSGHESVWIYGDAVTLDDAEPVKLGTDNDYEMYYDSTEDRLEFEYTDTGAVSYIPADKDVDLTEAGGEGASTATYTVAAQDSQNDHLADYVCDGTSDETEINQAISDLPSGTGGHIYLMEGNYTIDEPITDQGMVDVVLEGAGRGTKITLADETDTNMVDLASTKSWTIMNLWLDGNRANQSDDGNREIQCGIYADGSSDLIVKNNFVRETQYSGIRIQPDYVDTPVEGSPMTPVIIFGNDVRDVGDDGNSDVADDGISLAGDQNDGYESVRIQNNTVKNASHHYGIELAGEAHKKITVVNNTIETSQQGINPHDVNGVTVSSNVIENISDSGIACGSDTSDLHATVTSNVIKDTGNSGSEAGIKLFNVNARYSTVTGNTISDGYNGIWVDSDTEYNVVTSNTIEDMSNQNIIDDGSGNIVNNNIKQ